MFKVINIDTLPATTWKNGGGLTREIAKRKDAGALIWRLSIADVASDGPFSRFDGLTRILTVIKGDGIDLHAPGDVMRARLATPLRFSGELQIEGRLINGPIRDLNVIFDASRVAAEVQLVQGPQRIDPERGQTGFLVLAGSVLIDRAPVEPMSFAFGTQGRIDLGQGAHGLLVTLRPMA